MTQEFEEIWALECRLCDCQYKIDKTDSVVNNICPNLAEHLIQLKNIFEDLIPRQVIHKINTPIRNQTKENNNINRCVSICIADLVQYYNDINYEEQGLISD